MAQMCIPSSSDDDDNGDKISDSTALRHGAERLRGSTKTSKPLLTKGGTQGTNLAACMGPNNMACCVDHDDDDDVVAVDEAATVKASKSCLRALSPTEIMTGESLSVEVPLLLD